MVVLYSRGSRFSAQKYHPKTSLHNSLAALVWHSQAQQCLDPTPFQEVMKNSYLTQFSTS